LWTRGVEGAPPSHYGLPLLIVLGGGGQAHRGDGGGEGDRAGETDDGKVIVVCESVILRMIDPLCRGDNYLPITSSDVMITQDNPQQEHRELTMSSSENCGGAQEGSSTPGARTKLADQRNLPGKLILPCWFSSYYPVNSH